ncbi:MAG: WYL domain-containing protein [Nitrospiraceae bacterium]
MLLSRHSAATSPQSPLGWCPTPGTVESVRRERNFKTERPAQWVLSWGKEVKVLSPPELVQLVKEQLTKSLRHYKGR